MIISQQGIPITHDVEHVYLYMENWGRIKNPNWYYDTVLYLWHILNDDDGTISREGIMFPCIYNCVREMVRNDGLDVDARIDILTTWTDAYFNWTKNVTKDMWELVFRSEAHVHNKINQLSVADDAMEPERVQS